MQKIIGIILIVVCIIGFLQFFLGERPSKNIQPHLTNQRADKNDADSKLKVVSFYSEYLSCISNSQEDEKSKICLKNNSELTNSISINNSKSNQILCSNIFPSSYEVIKATITNKVAHVQLIEKIEGVEVPIDFQLKLDGDSWKITSVTCD